VSLTIFERRVVGPLDCNCYVVGDEIASRAIVIDPGGDAAELAESIQARGLEVDAIVATHAHFDHILGAEALRRRTGAPFYLHGDDRPLLDWMQESGRLFLGVDLPPPPAVDCLPAEGDVISAGSCDLQVIHTPGHSPGSISLWSGETLFAGDTLFSGSIGRSDLPGGDSETLLEVIVNKLFRLGGGVRVFPGHGPETTIEREKTFNPFVGNRGANS